MSDASAPPTRPRRHVLVNQIAEGITFVLFIATITQPHAAILAAAVVWTLLALALLPFFRGNFTFAIPLSQSSNTEDGRPHLLSTLFMMSMGLGIVGVIGAFRIDILLALGDAALLGCILFSLALLADPLLRTKTQIALLAVQCLFWTLGARIAIVGLLNG